MGNEDVNTGENPQGNPGSGEVEKLLCHFSSTFKPTQLSSSVWMSGCCFDEGMGMWNSKQGMTGFACATACLLSSTDFFVKSVSWPWFGIT